MNSFFLVTPLLPRHIIKTTLLVEKSMHISLYEFDVLCKNCKVLLDRSLEGEAPLNQGIEKRSNNSEEMGLNKIQQK